MTTPTPAVLAATSTEALAVDGSGTMLRMAGSDYGSLYSQSNQTPRLTLWTNILTEGSTTNQALLAAFPQSFDLDIAVGQQLDYTGQHIGPTRLVELPLTNYFSFDTVGLGWDQGSWYAPYSPSSYHYALSDSQYRMLLKSAIMNNYWDGSIPGIYRIWDALFPPGTGPFVFAQDTGNMTMLLGLGDSIGTIDPVTTALFNSGKLMVKPVGVRVNYATIATTPGAFFAFDLENSSFKGWDEGQWATITSA
jgi:hypothetical protein